MSGADMNLTQKMDIYLYMMKGFKKRQIKGETALMDVAGSDWNFTTQNLVNRDKKGTRKHLISHKISTQNKQI